MNSLTTGPSPSIASLEKCEPNALKKFPSNNWIKLNDTYSANLLLDITIHHRQTFNLKNVQEILGLSLEAYTSCSTQEEILVSTEMSSI